VSGVVGTAIYIRMRLQTMQRRGGSCSRRALAVWNGRLADYWNRAAIANVKLLRDLPLPSREQGSLRVIGAPPPVLAREEPPARLVSPSVPGTTRPSNTTVKHDLQTRPRSSKRPSHTSPITCMPRYDVSVASEEVLILLRQIATYYMALKS